MGLFKKFVNQTRKPQGFLGKIMLKGMNGSGHAKLADFGIDKLPAKRVERIAELGCGGGRNISVLLKKYAGAYVVGVDYSPLSVEKATKYNEKNSAICKVVQGDIRALDLDRGSFDLATAFETIYFWQDLDKCFKNVYEILKDGGTFLIVNESDGLDKTGKKFEKIIDGMKVYMESEITVALKNAGFKEIKLSHHDKKPWIAVSAVK